MLSDEEKNAIEWLKSKINEYVIKSELDENIEIILNLIENLIFKTETQKELLKYKTDKIEKQSKEIEEINKSDASKEQSSMNYYNLYKELVDKIKAKIEELDKEYKEAYNKGFKTDMVNRLREIKLMQSLLEKE